jgi:hypothetical protein
MGYIPYERTDGVGIAKHPSHCKYSDEAIKVQEEISIGEIIGSTATLLCYCVSFHHAAQAAHDERNKEFVSQRFQMGCPCSS